MLLKFLKNGKTYECENIKYIDAQKIKVTGKDIPSLDGGFDVINNEIVDNMYNKYECHASTIYQSQGSWCVQQSKQRAALCAEKA